MKNSIQPGGSSPALYKVCGVLMKVLAVFTAVFLGLPGLFGGMFGLFIVAVLATLCFWKVGSTWSKWAATGQEEAQNNEAPEAEPVQVEAAPSPKTEPSKIEHHRVAGTSFRLKEIQSLGVENSDYNLTKREMIDECLIGERVYRTDFYASKVELIPEPENPHDPRAIRVEADGVHIGYIKSGSCAHIHKLLNEDKIESIKCEMGGGRYKILLEDYDEDGNEVYEFERDEAPFYASLYIKIKQDAEHPIKTEV